MRRSAKRPCVRNQAIMAIPPSRGTSQVPQLRSPLLGASKKVIRCDLSFLVMCSSTVHLTDARPHSTPTSPSPTQAASAAPVPPSEADRALTCTYHLLSFPICPLDIALSHCFSACSDDARLRCARVDAFVVSIAVSTSGHHFLLSKHHPLSTIICPWRTTGSS